MYLSLWLINPALGPWAPGTTVGPEPPFLIDMLRLTEPATFLHETSGSTVK